MSYRHGSDVRLSPGNDETFRIIRDQRNLRCSGIRHQATIGETQQTEMI
jgi:hypothetical protein